MSRIDRRNHEQILDQVVVFLSRVSAHFGGKLITMKFETFDTFSSSGSHRSCNFTFEALLNTHDNLTQSLTQSEIIKH